MLRREVISSDLNRLEHGNNYQCIFQVSRFCECCLVVQFKCLSWHLHDTRIVLKFLYLIWQSLDLETNGQI